MKSTTISQSRRRSTSVDAVNLTPTANSGIFTRSLAAAAASSTSPFPTIKAVETDTLEMVSCSL